MNESLIVTGESILNSAEGATTPETLRQKDRCRNNSGKQALPHRRSKSLRFQNRWGTKRVIMGVQKTALYDLHKSLGAKFVPFAGYEMPIQYKDGIVKEHISTRTHAGFFDVSHMGQFFLEGDETLIESLEKIIPADLKNLKINHSKYSFLLNNEGLSLIHISEPTRRS